MGGGCRERHNVAVRGGAFPCARDDTALRQNISHEQALNQATAPDIRCRALNDTVMKVRTAPDEVHIGPVLRTSVL